MQRAYQQIDALKSEVETFLEGNPYGASIQLRRIRGAREAPCVVDFTIRMLVKEPCPRMWIMFIGEIIDDIRSALDHLVFQLVIHATNNPPGDRSHTQFPIFND